MSILTLRVQLIDIVMIFLAPCIELCPNVCLRIVIILLIIILLDGTTVLYNTTYLGYHFDQQE
jgi:hypothetical protein